MADLIIVPDEGKTSLNSVYLGSAVTGSHVDLPIQAQGILFTGVSAQTASTNTDDTLQDLQYTGGIPVGCHVSGSGIQDGTLVESISSGTEVILTLPTTATASLVPVTFWTESTQLGTVNGTTDVSGLFDTSGLNVGDYVNGDFITPGTTIAHIVSDTEITLSAVATSSQIGMQIFFFGVATDLQSLIQPDFSGYAAVNMSVNGTAGINGDDQDVCQYAPITFVCTADGLPFSCYGYAIQGAKTASADVPNAILWMQMFPLPYKVIENTGDSAYFQPQLFMGQIPISV